MNEEDFIKFAKVLGKLKELKRTGWKTHADIPSRESVADHSFRVAVLGMVLADMKGLDSGKVAKMALLHDLEESIMGDITAPDKEKMVPEELERREEDAINKALENLPEDLRKEYYELWREHMELKTEEAKIVNLVDTIDMMIQALEYEEKFPEKSDSLQIFWDSRNPKLKSLLKNETGKLIFDKLVEIRKSLK